MQEGKEPNAVDFIVIGAMKSGTTSLFHYLRAHPDVYMPAGKELDYFVVEKNWRRGREWYLAQFDPGRALGRTCGEASTNYSKYPTFQAVPARIAALVPEVRLVYLVRDPLVRLRSHARHRNQDTGSRLTLEEAVRDPHLRACSNYALQLERYLGHFAPDRLLVVASEDLRRRGDETLARIQRFLGLAASRRDPGLEAEFGVTDPSLSASLGRLPPRTAARVREEMHAEVARLEHLTGQQFDWPLADEDDG